MLLGDIYKPLLRPLYHDNNDYVIKIIKDDKVIFDGILNSNKYSNLHIKAYHYDSIENKFICIAE